MHRISQRLALLCGGLCLALSLLLVLISTFSSRFILEQQADELYGNLAEQLATDIAPVVASGDLIRLEATLRALREQHELLQIEVIDLDQRPLGQSGDGITADSHLYKAQLVIGEHVAGELRLATAPGQSSEDQRGMSFGLLVLAILGSVFAAAMAARWGQQLGERMLALREHLAPDDNATEDELEALEQSVMALPLDLLRPPDNSDQRTAEFEEAGLLYVRLESLASYVETLDEQSLLAYTEVQRKLVDSVAALYGGSLTVAREFGLLVNFAGSHATGSPGFRAASCGWLLMQLTADLDAARRLTYGLGLACGLGEASRDNSRDIYPALYNQHIIDELAEHCVSGSVVLSPALAADSDVQNRCSLGGGEGFRTLEGFTGPQADLLERQRQLLLKDSSAAGQV